jgi:holo-[acyl-carrier protein] synthase
MGGSAGGGETPGSAREPAPPAIPPIASGTSELGIDIIKVGRIASALRRFGPRFSARVLTPAERRYVRERPETFAGRWAAKEAVSKVLGLGVRGIGWRDIEIERLPTGQPAVRLHGRAAGRAEQLGMERVAVSISHEADYAVAIAFGIRSAGGRYVFPLDIEERLDERERRLLARLERLQALAARGDAAVAGSPSPGSAGVDGPARTPAGRAAAVRAEATRSAGQRDEGDGGPTDA